MAVGPSDIRVTLPPWIPVYAGILGTGIRHGLIDPEEATRELRAIAHRNMTVQVRDHEGKWRGMKAKDRTDSDR